MRDYVRRYNRRPTVSQNYMSELFALNNSNCCDSFIKSQINSAECNIIL
jgi:hypothetical protein